MKQAALEEIVATRGVSSQAIMRGRWKTYEPTCEA